MDMIETKRTAVLNEITEIPLRLLTREILHKQTVLGVLECSSPSKWMYVLLYIAIWYSWNWLLTETVL